MKRLTLVVFVTCISIGLYAQEPADKEKFDNMLLIASTQKFPYVGKLRLEQNYPNPLVRSESTTIRYQATDDQNIGQVKINGSQLKQGAYIYALLVNGRMVEKRKMVVVD